MRCSVSNCVSHSKKSNKDLSWFKFPRSGENILLWVSFCNLKRNLNTKYARICSLHFRPDDFRRTFHGRKELNQRRRCLKPGRIPSIKANAKQSIEEVRRMVEDNSLDIKVEQSIDEAMSMDGSPPPEKVINTEESDSLEELTNLRKELEILRRENTMLRVRENKRLKDIDDLNLTIDRLNSSHKNMEEALGRVFTKDQMQEEKSGEPKNEVENNGRSGPVNGQSITVYSGRGEAFKLSKKSIPPLMLKKLLCKFPRPSTPKMQIGQALSKIDSKPNSELRLRPRSDSQLKIVKLGEEALKTLRNHAFNKKK